MKNRSDYCIAPRLKKTRTNAGLTQIEMARRLFVDAKTLRLWERGDKDIPFQQAINWSYETKVPFEYIALGRLPLKNALEQMTKMRLANIAAATNALMVARKNAEKMEQQYIDNWAVEFETYR